MKKALPFLLLLALPLAARAQNAWTADDTSARVVDLYLRMLNVEAVPADSCLLIETAVTQRGSSDTVTMRRWYARRGMQRVEVWHRGKLETGLCTNGADRIRAFNRRAGWWEDVDSATFALRLMGFDHRGPLDHWREKGATLAWMGNTTLDGATLQVVRVDMPRMYQRYYLFDPDNHLLTLVIETANADIQEPNMRLSPDTHVDLRAYHEYTPLGQLLLPTLESFVRDGETTVLSSTLQFIALDPLIFNRDR